MSNVTRQQRNPDYIVGIGASAGGLEALQLLFAKMPENLGVAFVVIQHLSPDFQSVMDELLKKVTSIPVHYIDDGMEIFANNIYLNTPRTNVFIAEEKFIVADLSADNDPRMPIDTFFRALAETQQEKAIAIVLSGTGSDGSRGIRSVKEAGGLVVAQEPNEAKFNGMPISAINTGLVDFIVNTQAMPARIEAYINHPLIKSNESILRKNLEEDKEALEDVFTLLKDYSDIDFGDYKASTVARRIERRMGINQITNLRDYYLLLMSKPRELQVLNKDLLIGVTDFFRDKEAFDVLRSEVLPEIVRSCSPGETIRVWVAGCSTGEEAYSIAIALDQCMEILNDRKPVKIFATDVDSDAISEAGLGQYNQHAVRDLGPVLLEEYFSQEGDNSSVKPHIRRMVIFAVHNLIKDPPFSNIHLATCRNVLIYLQQSVQRRVLASLQFSMVQHGYLFLGSSESLSEVHKSYSVIHDKHRIFKKTDNVRLPLPVIRHDKHDNRLNSSKAPSISLLLKSHRSQERNISYKPVIEKLFERFIPPAVVVDENINVVHIYGDVEPFTRKHSAGQFSANAGSILHDDVSVTVQTAIHSALEKKADILYENVAIQKSSQPILVDILAIYVDADYIGDRHVIVSFKMSEANLPKGKIKALPFDDVNQNKKRIEDLENELKRKQEHLQVTVEELETTNEELQASNEELMAANEELQSTNEELQSVNEELYTVNNEFQQKIDEITQINTDLDNLIQSSQAGMIFLDDMLMIRNYTPTVALYINLLPTDIGRPFHHISHKLNYDTLLQDISYVINTRKPRLKETRSNDDVDLLVKINPYITEDNAVRGCVILCTDISEVKGLRKNLSQTQLTLKSLFRSASNNLNAHNISILLFDDNKEDVKLIKNMFTRIDGNGYEIFTAYNEGQAKKVLKEREIQICLIDYELGDQYATDFIASLDNDLRVQVAFILITNHMTDAIEDAAIREGVINSIEKQDLSPSLLKHVTRSTYRALSAIRSLGEKLDSEQLAELH